MVDITARTDVVEVGKKRPLSQFRKKQRFMGLLAALLTEVQALETATVESIAKRYIWNATGWALDCIGLLVGLPRPAYGPAATDDNVYRVQIYGQIAANISYGTLPDLYNILRSLQLSNVRLLNIYPASVTVNYINNSQTLTCGCIRSILEKATHPIEFDITQHSAAPFGFEGDLDAFGFDDGELGEGI